MNALVLELLPYVRQGYCCSQLLLVLAMQLRGEDNPGLLRAMRGPCHGIGQSGGPCGLLSGGAAALAWLSGVDGGDEHPMLEAMINEYGVWFLERTLDWGYSCESIIQGLASEAGKYIDKNDTPDMSLCAEFLVQCWDKIMEIHDVYHLDTVGI